MLTVTDVRIKKFEKGMLKGFATITLNAEFVVSGLMIMNKKDGGVFVSMPKEKGSDGNYYDSAFPLSKELRTHIQDAVLIAYNKEQ